MIEQQIKNDNPLNMYYNQVWLKDTGYHSDRKFPLGLYMSEGACDSIHKRAKKIAGINAALMDSLKTYFTPHKNQ